MLPQTSKISKQILGSSLIFSAQGGRGKEKNCKPAEKIAVGSEGEAEGGVWGREFRLARAEAKPRRPARSEQNPAKKFSFPFRRKKRGAQIKKCEENFFAGWRALASGGGAERQNSQSGFSSKKVRILTKRHRQFSEFGF